MKRPKLKRLEKVRRDTCSLSSKRRSKLKKIRESPELLFSHCVCMIRGEIFKSIPQIENRTNRPVAETLANFGSGERARLGRSQRRPRRWLRVARVQTDSLRPRRNVRREGAPNRSRGGCAPGDSALRIPRSAFI